jgi:hypothetical protein
MKALMLVGRYCSPVPGVRHAPERAFALARNGRSACSGIAARFPRNERSAWAGART